MVSQKSIQDFIEQKKLAVVGVSRDARQFSYQAYSLLKIHGYKVYPINPNTDKIGEDTCYPNVKSLPEQMKGALVMLPPEKTMQVLPEIVKAGIKHVWLQQQTEAPQAIQFCTDHGINVVYSQCIMMFIEPLSFPHCLHRWGKKVIGNLPK
jgi:predicted CoA-binding protein